MKNRFSVPWAGRQNSKHQNDPVQSKKCWRRSVFRSQEEHGLKKSWAEICGNSKGIRILKSKQSQIELLNESQEEDRKEEKQEQKKRETRSKKN